jgi:MFS-type transporter involved in bile tolerance (Atg22 family)
MLKNWFRIMYIMLCSMGILVYLSLFLLKKDGAEVNFSIVCFILAPVMFFVGTIVYNALKWSPKTDTLASYAQLATGAVASLLFLLSAKGLFEEDGLVSLFSMGVGDWYTQAFITIPFIGQFLIFAFLPLMKGINKTLAVTPEHPLPAKKVVEAPVAPAAPVTTPTPTVEVAATPAAPAPKPKKPSAPKA